MGLQPSKHLNRQFSSVGIFVHYEIVEDIRFVQECGRAIRTNVRRVLSLLRRCSWSTPFGQSSGGYSHFSSFPSQASPEGDVQRKSRYLSEREHSVFICPRSSRSYRRAASAVLPVKSGFRGRYLERTYYGASSIELSFSWTPDSSEAIGHEG